MAFSGLHSSQKPLKEAGLIKVPFREFEVGVAHHGKDLWSHAIAKGLF
ncbi:MAG: hypothetical protein K9J17_11550 [Flavobacteriales bacterium]|nr:hypothetical protein [Flavobacteriales bacterium]